MRFLVPGTETELRHRLSTLDLAAEDSSARAAVDSGRLAEPFWYVDSPLTTPNPYRPFHGRPPRGTVPSPGPGILVPDATGLGRDGDQPIRFRELARDGLLLLTTGGTYLDGASSKRKLDRESSRQATEVPTRMLSLSGIDVTGALTAALDARPGEVWVIRPDAHIAAVLRKPGPQDLVTALLRALGRGVADEYRQ